MERAGIPFTSVAGRGFYSRPEIRDLINTLQALADPTDDLALTGLLRSPAAGFTDAEIVRLRLDADWRPRPLWPTLQAQPDARSQTLVARVAELHAVAGRIAVAELIKRWLDATDYVAAYLHAGERRAARNVAKLLDDAQRSTLSSVGEFLEYVQNVRDVGAREGEARADDEGLVQIMTVHQAKGLEFPVVVIGDAASSGGSRGPGLIMDEIFGVLPNLADEDGARPIVTKLAALRNQEQEAAESERLLYVAATRAADKLIISGNVTVNRSLAVTATGWLGAVLSAASIAAAPAGFQEDGAGAYTLEAAFDGEPVLCTLYEPQFEAAGQAPPGPSANLAAAGAPWVWDPAMIHPIEPPAGAVPLDDPSAAGLPPTVAALAQPEDRIGRRVWRVAPHEAQDTAPAWVVGKLVHEAIAGWRFPLDDAFGAWVTARTREYGLADQQRIADAARKTRTLLLRLQHAPIFGEMAAATQRLHELPYARLLDSGQAGDRQPTRVDAAANIDVGYIDLLMRTGELWTIVDFKTDHIPSHAARVDLLTAHGYGEQLARYRAAVAALIGQPPRVLLCLLDDNGSVTVLDGATLLP